MRVIAYCMRSVAPVVHRASGTFPITCPPFDVRTFDPKVFEWADFIWIGLHGVSDRPDYLYGDEIVSKPFPIRLEALRVEGIADLNLTDKLVYAATCYMPSTNFPEAFRAAGATVVGGEGKNYGSHKRIVGVDKLGRALMTKFAQTQDISRVAKMLAEAKKELKNNKADIDAKQFEVL
jgi:hypothetical protein